MKSKVKAFTILEMTVTMLITALLIGLMYASYSFIVKSHHDFSTKNDELGAFINLDHLLKRDFDQANLITSNLNIITVQKYTEVITYQFSPGFIVRNAARTDTFKVQTQTLGSLFENKPINELEENDIPKRIDQLEFIVLYQTEKIPYVYHKLYSAENLIIQNIDGN